MRYLKNLYFKLKLGLIDVSSARVSCVGYYSTFFFFNYLIHTGVILLFRRLQMIGVVLLLKRLE